MSWIRKLDKLAEFLKKYTGFLVTAASVSELIKMRKEIESYLNKNKKETEYSATPGPMRQSIDSGVLG